MDKSKLDGTVDESLVEQHIHKSNIIISSEKSRALHLAKLGPCRQAGWLTDKINVKFENFKAFWRSKYSIFALFSQGKTLFQHL